MTEAGSRIAAPPPAAASPAQGASPTPVTTPAPQPDIAAEFTGGEPAPVRREAAGAETRQSPPPALAPASVAPAGQAERAQAVAAQIAAAASSLPGQTRIEVQLDPPELGRVEIAIDIADQGLRAAVTAERGQTGDLLRRYGDILFQNLQEAGFTEIDLRFADGRNARGGQGPWGTPQTGQSSTAPDDATQAAPAGTAPPPSADRLDLRL